MSPGSELFGYQLDTIVKWRSWLEAYTSATGTYTWYSSNLWYWHRAGTDSGQPLDQWTFTSGGPVRIESALGGWLGFV